MTTPTSNKIRASCDHCHVRKVKCSSKRPACSRCVDLNLVCTYSPAQKYGRPSNAELQRRQQEKKKKQKEEEERRGKGRPGNDASQEGSKASSEAGMSPRPSSLSPHAFHLDGSMHGSQATLSGPPVFSDSDSAMSPLHSGSSTTDEEISPLASLDNFGASDLYNASFNNLLDDLMIMPSTLFHPTQLHDPSVHPTDLNQALLSLPTPQSLRSTSPQPTILPLQPSQEAQSTMQIGPQEEDPANGCDCLTTLCRFQPQIESSAENLLCNFSRARHLITTQLSCPSCRMRYGPLHCVINAFNIAERILSCLHDVQTRLRQSPFPSVSIRIGNYAAPEGGCSSKGGLIVQYLLTVELDELEDALNTVRDDALAEAGGQEVIEARNRISGLVRRAKHELTIS